MQFIGERMKVQYASNFTDEFHKTIRNLLKYLEVGPNADCWTSVTNGAAPHISIYTLCHQSLIGEYGCLCKGSKSPLVHKLGVVQQ